MWGMSDSDSEEEEENPYADKADEVIEVKEEPPAGTTGLALAEHYFGPLLSPVAATPAQWTAYTGHRRGANAKYNNIFHRRKKSINNAVASIEVQLGLENGTLQKCICILGRHVEGDYIDPQNADIVVRIYSPAAPKYIDVHLKYHCRTRLYEIEWYYSLGYKICNRISGSPIEYSDPSTNGPPSLWHCRGGWQSICWGLYDDSGNYGRNWRRVEVADMGLHEEGVIDVHEALFGPSEKPPSGDADALLAYRRKLVATVRLLFAALGANYEVARTEDERDERPRGFMLEGLSDNWVARGIRAACGFQLSSDAEAAMRGKEERRESATQPDFYGEDDEDEDGYGFFDGGW
ncbi:hypothetical protein L210DRAFT_2268271 [Boletus edulis BED1]|uniref:Uncharacterized protein n=1 Tax=Boletus edulis BED1 TaxID=1328754 RepID=A0AAD4BSH5_BOLED|nr:hypothetical protein L210DRAFT_2268271 [Boletus edulis BED1]